MNSKLAAAAALGAALLAPFASAQESLRQAINPPTLPSSVQYGYSQAAVVSSGVRLVFVAGQVGVDPAGPNDFRSQVDRSFANLVKALEAAGARPQDVVKITVLIVDHAPDRLEYLGTKRRELFGANPPASTLIPVPKLYTEGVEFEIDATAVAPAR